VINISISYFHLHSKGVITVLSVDVYYHGGLLHIAAGMKHVGGTL